MSVIGVAIRAIANRRVAFVILDSGKATRQGPLCDLSKNPNAFTKGGLPYGNLLLADCQVQTARRMGLDEVHLTLPPHANGARHLTKYYNNPDLHGINVKLQYEDEIRGTLGAINRLFEIGRIKADEIDTLCIAFADTVHNIDLMPILAAHIESNAALTASVYEIDWVAREWDSRSFGTFVLDGMPDRSTFNSFENFKVEQREFVRENRNNSVPVAKFCEQNNDANHFVNNSVSNLLFAGAAFFNIELWKALSENISSNYHDIGHDVFPTLGGRSSEFEAELNRHFLDKIDKNQYPFHAYIVPDKDDRGELTYCWDVTNPYALLKLNHQVARGLIDTRIGDPDCAFWRKLHPYGYVGTSGTNPDSWHLKFFDPEPGYPNSVGPIIGSHTDFDKTRIDPDTVVRDYATIYAESLRGTLVNGGDEDRKVYIGEGIRLVNCIVVAPVRLERRSEYFSSGRNPFKQNMIIHGNPSKPEWPIEIPIDTTFAPNGRKNI